MTRDEFVKKSFRAYMIILYNLRHNKEQKQIECLLVSIDFDNELMTLQPLEDTNFSINDGLITTSISNCSIPIMHRNHSELQINRKNN